MELGDDVGERCCVLDPALAPCRWVGGTFYHQVGEHVALAGQGEQADGTGDAPVAGQTHGGSSAVQWLIGWSKVAHRYWTP